MTNSPDFNDKQEPRVSPDVPDFDEAAEPPSQAPFPNIYVIVNPAAGQDQPILGLLNNAFRAAGVNWDLFLTKQAGDGYRLAQEAVAAGVDAVAVYGGDGTVMEVANGLAGSGVPMAIFPGGTANVVSVELGIPGDLAEATALICNTDHVIRDIDVGQVKDRLFLLRLGIGFEADMMNHADRGTKDRIGRLAYILSALETNQHRQIAHYRLTLDGETVEADGVTCMIANSGNLGLPGLSLAKSILVNDGLLDVVVIRDTDVGSLLEVAANAIGVADTLQHWQAHEITVEADPPQAVICDGEPIEQTPVSARVLEHALRVIVPTAAANASSELENTV